MKKETKAYCKNTVKSKSFMIDVINLFLGVFIVVLAVMVFESNDRLYLFPIIFFVGAILMTLNSIKSMKSSKVFAIFFLIFGILLLAAAFVSIAAMAGLI